MPRIFLLLAVVLGLIPPVVATQWTDPSFEEMVADAELIAVIQVVEGGKFLCIAKALEVLKGADPGGNFIMCEFNNPNWPAEGIAKESMARGERLLVFLHEQPLEDDEGELKDSKEAKEDKKTWAVPTPSTGDFRIIDGKLHGGWYDVSYPHSSAGIDAQLTLALIRGYLLHLAGKPPAEARKLLGEKLTADLSKGVTEEDEGEENQRKVKLLEWLLCAQGAYGEKGLAPAVLAAAKAKHDLVKICAARALRSAGNSEEILSALNELLGEGNSFVEAEAAKSLMLNGFPREKAIPLLLKALPGSSVNQGGPTRIMDPLLNTSASGRESIIRALTFYSAEKEAHDELLKLIQDEGLEKGVFIALAEHFLKFRSEKARAKFLELYDRCPEGALPLFHGYLLQEKSPEAIQAVAKRITNGDIDAWACRNAFKALLAALPRNDPILEKVLKSLLDRFKGIENADNFFEFAIPVTSPEIAGIVLSYSSDELNDEHSKLLKLVRKAVRLKLDANRSAPKKLESWLKLIAETGENEFLLKELPFLTPPDLREATIRKLREIRPENSWWYHGSKAIQDLGGTPTSEEERDLKEFGHQFEVRWFR
jgi:hypothetical protein